ncbi:MAG: divergent polysaccharide deacetylase family protein [Treponema sp.]|nr:divergent polysaccharide deacetylase family protein [Treponema sp.]
MGIVVFRNYETGKSEDAAALIAEETRSVPEAPAETGGPAPKTGASPEAVPPTAAGSEPAAKPAEPARSAQPVPAQPAKPAKPAEPVKPAAPEQPRKQAAKPAAAPKPAAAAKPAVPEEPPDAQVPGDLETFLLGPSLGTPAASGSQTSFPERPGQGRLVFVIDDAGNNLQELEPFLNFPGPLTIAVLPGLPHSAEAARRIRAAGKEVLLHQPMEALGGQNPGPGAVFAGMGAEEIRFIVNKNLDEIWPVAGINNHEGSRVTMDEKAMETILEICRERGILFLDSRTTADTAAPAAARRLGMKIGERDVFLDNSQSRESILNYLNTGLGKAEQRGAAIMIGHTWSPALAPLLKEHYSAWIARGYTLSTVSELIKAAP